jgi:hypothetical protein
VTTSVQLTHPHEQVVSERGYFHSDRRQSSVVLEELKCSPIPRKTLGMSVHQVYLYEVTDDLCTRSEPPLPVKQLCDSCRWPTDQTVPLPSNDTFEESDSDPYWRQVQQQLSADHKSIDDWINAIRSYSELASDDFSNLKTLFESELSDSQSKAHLDRTLPEMGKLALQLPQLLPLSLPFLVQNVNRCLHLTQQQVACLLANAFFCTFRPKRKETGKLPIINFNP